MSKFEEFNSSGDPAVPCPGCGGPCIFATNLKKMGEQRIRVCRTCRAVYHNDKKVGTLDVHPKEEA